MSYYTVMVREDQYERLKEMLAKEGDSPNPPFYDSDTTCGMCGDPLSFGDWTESLSGIRFGHPDCLDQWIWEGRCPRCRGVVSESPTMLFTCGSCGYWWQYDGACSELEAQGPKVQDQSVL